MRAGPRFDRRGARQSIEGSRGQGHSSKAGGSGNNNNESVVDRQHATGERGSLCGLVDAGS